MKVWYHVVVSVVVAVIVVAAVVADAGCCGRLVLRFAGMIVVLLCFHNLLAVNLLSAKPRNVIPLERTFGRDQGRRHQRRRDQQTRGRGRRGIRRDPVALLPPPAIHAGR